MVAKIKKLAKSPAILSTSDMENFVKIMELSTIELNLLKDSKKIIKKYYLTGETKPEDEYILDKTLDLVFEGKVSDESNHDIHEEKQNNNTKKQTVETNYIKPIKEQILEIAQKYEKDDIFVGRNIPTDKLNNFKSVHKYKTIADVLVFVDCTVFGSGKNAIVITSRGLHSYHDFASVQKDVFITWKEIFEYSISENTESDYEIKIGGKSINTSGSNSDMQDIIYLLRDLHKELRKTQQGNSENTDINKCKIGKLEPDISITKALQNPYQSMEKFIQDTFLYVSPIYAIAVHFTHNHVNEEDSIEEFRNNIETLSNKHKLEELILETEKQILELFTETIKSTREDIKKINGQDIGNIFSYNDDILSSLQQEMIKYRNYIIPKMNELHAYAEQLKNFWIHNEEGTGQSMKNFIKGGALGMAGAAMFGPLGIAAAMGANYFGASEDAKKKEAVFDTIYNNWANAHDSFYFTQLHEYYRAYKNLILKIAQQYTSNYQLAHDFSDSHGKKLDYEEYIKEEITGMVFNDELIEMRQELLELSEFIHNERV